MALAIFYRLDSCMINQPLLDALQKNVKHVLSWLMILIGLLTKGEKTCHLMTISKGGIKRQFFSLPEFS